MDDKRSFGRDLFGGTSRSISGGTDGHMSKGSRGFEKDIEPPYSPPENPQAFQSAPSFRTNFASVSLHMSDRIRLLRFPPDQVAQIQEVIRQSWPRGIQEVRPYDQSQEIKLRGGPWRHRWDKDKIDARKLLCALLQTLFDMGWILKAAVDVSRKEYDKDTMIFRHQIPAPPPCRWISISFDKGDLMHIFNAPRELNQSFVTSIGLRVQGSQYLQPAVFEIKFTGYPWRPNGTDAVQQRVFILNFMECLEQHGFTLYVSMTLDDGPGGDDHASGADTWFCNQPANWTPGVPIYH